jgi:putative redox protein
MVKIIGTYEGELHCDVLHTPSKTIIETDAPVDNKGKGEKFSPTDLVAAALGSCILTTMAIAAEKHQLSLKGTKIEVIKEMIVVPARKIKSLTSIVTMPKNIPEEFRERLERAAHTCPVHKSLDAEVERPIKFEYLA